MSVSTSSPDVRTHVAVYTDRIEQYRTIIAQHPDVTFTITDRADEFVRAATHADVLFMAQKYERHMVLNAPRMQWLHVAGTGVDRLRPFDDFRSEVTITHTPSINAAMIADYVICAMGMLAWDVPQILRNQWARRWERWPVSRLATQTLGVVGLGNIGQAVARRAHVMGMRVVGSRRTPKPVAGVERVYAADELHALLGEADYVVLAVPLTSETAGLIGAAELRCMKTSAYLVNVSRGGIVREAALVDALRSSTIAGAALDVFETEPLPEESELWDLDNVILTPHISAWSEDYRIRAREVFAANLQRYLSGRPLRHVIDRSREY